VFYLMHTKSHNKSIVFNLGEYRKNNLRLTLCGCVLDQPDSVVLFHVCISEVRMCYLTTMA